jgi:PBP1b-binding outer membrane lipoprotein LpoB
MKVLMKYQLLFVIGLLQITNGCMMGMHTSKANFEKSLGSIQSTNRSDKIETMLAEMIDDLSSKNFDIEKITVWDIQSKSAGIDLDRIRHQLIDKLVNDTKFQVVTRKRLRELLEEQNLALSGVLDVDDAVAIGKLVEIEGFMAGYLSVEDDEIEINLSLIDAKKGVVVWVLTRSQSI